MLVWIAGVFSLRTVERLRSRSRLGARIRGALMQKQRDAQRGSERCVRSRGTAAYAAELRDPIDGQISVPAQSCRRGSRTGVSKGEAGSPSEISEFELTPFDSSPSSPLPLRKPPAPQEIRVPRQRTTPPPHHHRAVPPRRRCTSELTVPPHHRCTSELYRLTTAAHPN